MPMFGVAGEIANLGVNIIGRTVNKVRSAITSATTTPSVHDCASFSPESMARNRVANSRYNKYFSPQGRANVDKLQSMFKAKGADIREKLANICDENHVDLSVPFQLDINEAGEITVLGEHPQKEKLQQILRGIEGFTQSFAETRALGEYLSEYYSQIGIL